MSEVNDGFGLPPAEEAQAALASLDAKKPLDDKARLAALREKARAQAAKEFDDDAVFAKLLAEERAKRSEELLRGEGVNIPVNTQGFPEEYVKIHIFASSNKDDPQYVPLGIGGFVIRAPRDEDIIVPRVFVTECLDHAIEEKTVKFQGGLVTRPVHRFPYQNKGAATKAEYQAYIAQQREKAQRQLALAA